MLVRRIERVRIERAQQVPAGISKQSLHFIHGVSALAVRFVEGLHLVEYSFVKRHLHVANARYFVEIGDPIVVQILARIEVALREQVGFKSPIRVHIENEESVWVHMFSNASERALQIGRVENVVERIVQTRRGIEFFAQIESRQVVGQKSRRWNDCFTRFLIRHIDHLAAQIDADDIPAAHRHFKRRVAGSTRAIEYSLRLVLVKRHQQIDVIDPRVIRHDIHQFVIVRREVAKLRGVFGEIHSEL